MSVQMLPTVPPQSRKSMEALAAHFSEKFAPDTLRKASLFPVAEVFDCLQDHYPSLTFGVGQLPDGIEGMCFPDGRTLISEPTYHDMDRGGGRGRFTAIHEICHALHHMRHLKRELVETGTVRLRTKGTIAAYLDPEWQANTFASFVLMPTRPLVEMLKAERESMMRIARIQHTFGVSYTAANIRYSQVMDLLAR